MGTYMETKGRGDGSPYQGFTIPLTAVCPPKSERPEEWKMALVRWNPMREATSLREAMDRLFEESFIRQSMGDWDEAGGRQAWRLPVDVYSTPQEIVIQAAAPGIKPEQVEITIEGDTLTIRGELPGRPENVNYLFRELAAGKFVRVLSLNVPVDPDRAEARFENGLLTLVIPKAEEARPRQITVKAGTD
jgi:HSP20 family protein